MKILNKLKKTIFFVLMIIYEEIIFSSFVFGGFPITIHLIILFSIPIGILFDVITNCFNEKINKIISYIITIAFCILFGAHFVYNRIYKSIISIYSFANGSQVFQFYEKIVGVIKDNLLQIALLMLPIIILIALHKTKKIDFEKVDLKGKVIKLTAVLVIQIVATLVVNFGKNDDVYSNRSLYYNSGSLLMTARRFGICTTMRLDLKRLLFESDTVETVNLINKVVAQEEFKLDESLEYNKLDIDFESLAQNERNVEISTIHKYMTAQEPSEKNEYTGMFEGKNLIVIVAESLSNVAIREDITPTLYKLSNQGFEFKNFYTPLFPASTADGEYMTDTSLVPKEGAWSIIEIREDYIPYSYANVFKKLGYTTNSYHDYSYNFYDRDQYLYAMGYDSFLAQDIGLEDRMDCTRWPNSDLEMIQVTTDDYINNDNFLAYYMTVSGHLGYTREDNYLSDKNWNLVEDLPYSYRAKCYLAAQIELDRAVEQLIKDLDEAGKLEDTVILISGDHYPYGLELEEINELSTYERDDDFEKHNMPLIIWSASMEEPVVVEKIGSCLDVLPTMLNLFGIEYDSRLLMGRDILSNSDSLVILSNRSFITEKGRYNSITDEFINAENEDVDSEYIRKMKVIVEAKFQISRLILDKNYYSIIRDYIDM